MPQHSMNIANQAGAAFRADLNNALAALVGNNSGVTAPTTTYAYQFWADTANGLLKQRNAANTGWITHGPLADLGIQSSSQILANAAGTADAITATYTPAIATLTNGMTLYVRASAANSTTAPTFTPNSGVVAAKTIVKGAGAALVAGDVAGGGHWCELQYDQALDKWVLLNPATGVSPASTTTQGSIQLASAAEAAALANALKAITPATLAAAFQSTNQSMTATSGYQKLPGGLIIQWMKFTHPTADGSSQAVTFPLAFPNAAVSAVVTADAAAVIATCTALSTTGLTAYFHHRSSGTAVGSNGYFVVIGY